MCFEQACLMSSMYHVSKSYSCFISGSHWFVSLTGVTEYLVPLYQLLGKHEILH